MSKYPVRETKYQYFLRRENMRYNLGHIKYVQEEVSSVHSRLRQWVVDQHPKRITKHLPYRPLWEDAFKKWYKRRKRIDSLIR